MKAEITRNGDNPIYDGSGLPWILYRYEGAEHLFRTMFDDHVEINFTTERSADELREAYTAATGLEPYVREVPEEHEEEDMPDYPEGACITSVTIPYGSEIEIIVDIGDLCIGLFSREQIFGDRPDTATQVSVYAEGAELKPAYKEFIRSVAQEHVSLGLDSILAN